MRKFSRTERQTHNQQMRWRRWVFLCIHTASVATFTRTEATAHTPMRSTRSKLPFTYRTFGVRSAQPQSDYSQHAGYSEHLLCRNEGPRVGIPRRPLSSSLLLLSSFLFFFPSPVCPLPLIRSSTLSSHSSLVCRTRQHWVSAVKQRTAGTRVSPAVRTVSVEAGLESSAPRDQSEQRHREERLRRISFLFSSTHPNLSSSLFLSLLHTHPPPSTPSSPHPALSPVSQPTPLRRVGDPS